MKNQKSISAQLLIDINFEKIGLWKSSENKLTSIFEEISSIDLNVNNVLYAFTTEEESENEEIKYIGKTTRTLNQRMYEYANPGKGQKTNIRVNKEILNTLSQGKSVSIYIFKDVLPLNWGGFNLNIAAGLEDSLVYSLSPAWNKHGKNIITASEEIELEALSINYEGIKKLESEIKLGATYYNKGFFNLRKGISQYINESLTDIELRLEDGPKLIARIDRTTNPDNSIRLYYGNDLVNWLKKNYALGDILKALVIIEENNVIIEFQK